MDSVLHVPVSIVKEHIGIHLLHRHNAHAHLASHTIDLAVANLHVLAVISVRGMTV